MSAAGRGGPVLRGAFTQKFTQELIHTISYNILHR